MPPRVHAVAAVALALLEAAAKQIEQARLLAATGQAHVLQAGGAPGVGSACGHGRAAALLHACRAVRGVLVASRAVVGQHVAACGCVPSSLRGRRRRWVARDGGAARAAALATSEGCAEDRGRRRMEDSPHPTVPSATIVPTARRRARASRRGRIAPRRPPSPGVRAIERAACGGVEPDQNRARARIPAPRTSSVIADGSPPASPPRRSSETPVARSSPPAMNPTLETVAAVAAAS
jgi:hypothetical protein